MSAAGTGAGTPSPATGPRSRAAVGAVLAVGLAALLVTSLVILADHASRRSGTDLTTDTGYAISLGPGQQLCQPGELLPADTAALRIDADPRGAAGPPLQARLGGPSGALSEGRLAPGWSRGLVRIPLARLARESSGEVCLRNVGAQTIAFGGELPAQGFQITVAGQTFPGRLRIEYLRPGRESWLALTPTIVHRFSLGKSDLVRHWAAAGVLALMLIAAAFAGWALLREPA